MCKVRAGLWCGWLLVAGLFGCKGTTTVSKEKWCEERPDNPACRKPGLQGAAGTTGMAGTGALAPPGGGGGSAAPSCAPGLADCNRFPADGCETSLAADTQHCGGCGMACAANEICRGGSCECKPNCIGRACGDDGCGKPCGSCASGLACSAQGQCLCPGQCACVPQCAGKQCGDDGCGGSCGTCPPVANSRPVCMPNGTCASMCLGGFQDCDTNPSNGCETATKGNLQHCGACGVQCPTPPRATATCEAGRCGLVCDPGFDDCDGRVENGCETDLRNDPMHCGHCGVACGAAQAAGVCSNGMCGLQCAPGFGDCDGDPKNGCETPLNSLNHCGACRAGCHPAHAMAACTGGTCMIQQCDPKWGDCDRDPSNGCETSLTTLTDCGQCRNRCSVAGGPATCATGLCAPDGCNQGRADCDGNPSNGCETQLGTNLNCTGCGVRCDYPHAQESCGTGACVLTQCDPGWGDCDRNPKTGCETNLQSDPLQCGGCGTRCGDQPNATTACERGRCTYHCKPGYQDCGGVCVQMQSDPAHCGACNNACPSTQRCERGRCVGPLVLRATQLAGGSRHTCALTVSNTVRCWGGSGYALNDNYHTPGPELRDPNNPTQVWSDVRQLAAGNGYTCALTNAKQLHCWGQAMVANNPQDLVPGPPLRAASGRPLPPVRQIAAGFEHACAVFQGDGSATCWGSNRHGQLGNGAPWFDKPGPRVGPQGGVHLTAIVQVAAGFAHTCAELSTREVMCWGENAEYQLGLALKNGAHQSDYPVLVPNLSVAKLDLGRGWSCGVLKGGSASCWGPNAEGQLGYPDRPMHQQTAGRPIAGLAPLSLIHAGSFSTCAVLSNDGSVQCWGDNSDGELGIGKGTGGKMIWKSPAPKIQGLQGVVQVVGEFGRCALVNSGEVRCWGKNDFGQLGYGDTLDRDKPGDPLMIPE